MWRAGRLLLRSHQRRVTGNILAAQWNGVDQTFACFGIRSFARKVGGDLGDPDEELREMQEVEAGKIRAKEISATDMEFYSQLVDDDSDDEEDENALLTEEYKRKQVAIQQELDSRTGRVWKDPWEISEERWMSTATFDDLPKWTPEFVSRVSQERVQIHSDGIPTLSTLASMSLPEPASPNPGEGKTKDYATYRKNFHYKYIEAKVMELAEPKLEGILKLTDMNDKQDAVDVLFETVEEELRQKEEILGKHPHFSKWVERALETYLQNAKKTGTAQISGHGAADPQPVFMDCFDDNDADAMVPSILSPLKPHPQDGTGRMVEDWELSAHKKTKRILIRESSSVIAQALENNESSKIFVHGRKGVGKTAVLASVVASARKSGYIVMYLPDGDRLRKNGYFVTPNVLRKGMFDLQNLSQEACAQLLENHGEDLQGLEADNESMTKYFEESQLSKVTDYNGESIALVDLLNYAEEKKNHAPMCYSVVVDRLMSQDEKPFLMVMDEFNCFYDRGHYFHMAYDEDVREAIPYDKINLFEHAMSAMSLSADEDEIEPKEPMQIRRGGIIVGTTESHAVRRKVTSALVDSAQSRSGSIQVVEVPRFSEIEVEHILANFEATGIGKLRLDRGDTVMDEQEVEYLKMVSGRVGQKLLDASFL
ncbi:unnamed protein product [Cylindrotheca closterium]|uniref:Small ribosomal subunit protein mS29 n=1 Tax=Cylindrotheca closterium TaxID=2856 RepID=A0AAD2FG91_9STRA|nr:unnamed protein product [Cylindrotheca closterium]